MTQVYEGEVVWFSNKGFGFINSTINSENKDLFVHWKNVLKDGYKTLYKGQKVEFQLGENHKGVQAVNVRVL